MPIKPPNLDDRRYADIVNETKKMIPQYCPEWTNFSAADPGMTLVQLFAFLYYYSERRAMRSLLQLQE